MNMKNPVGKPTGFFNMSFSPILLKIIHEKNENNCNYCNEEINYLKLLFETWYKNHTFSYVTKWLLCLWQDSIKEKFKKDVIHLEIDIIRDSDKIWKFPFGFVYPFNQPDTVEKPLIGFFKYTEIVTLVGFCDIKTVIKFKLLGYEIISIEEIITKLIDFYEIKF